jgi:hypothetical protein
MPMNMHKHNVVQRYGLAEMCTVDKRVEQEIYDELGKWSRRLQVRFCNIVLPSMEMSV